MQYLNKENTSTSVLEGYLAQFFAVSGVKDFD